MPLNNYVGAILILIGLIGSILLLFVNSFSPLLRLGLIGIWSFTWVLFGAYCLNTFQDFSCGEFRKAITISILVVFFASLAMGDQIMIAPDSILGQVLNNYWAILSTVIAFYFASRVLDDQNAGDNLVEPKPAEEPVEEPEK